MRKYFLIFILLLSLILQGSTSTPKIEGKNSTTPYQAKQFLKDRHCSKKMLDCVDFIYDYCDEVGIDATLIIGISSIETGYGKSRLFVSNNNPGGMKSRRGWMKFSSSKQGYKAMIDKIAVMAGVIPSDSYYYNSCVYIRDLGNIYWVENGCDKGYYSMLIKQMNRIKSYPNNSVNKEHRKGTDKLETSNEKKISIERKLTPKEYLYSFIKEDTRSGLEIIYNAIGK